MAGKVVTYLGGMSCKKVLLFQGKTCIVGSASPDFCSNKSKRRFRADVFRHLIINSPLATSVRITGCRSSLLDAVR